MPDEPRLTEASHQYVGVHRDGALSIEKPGRPRDGVERCRRSTPTRPSSRTARRRQRSPSRAASRTSTARTWSRAFLTPCRLGSPSTSSLPPRESRRLMNLDAETIIKARTRHGSAIAATSSYGSGRTSRRSSSKSFAAFGRRSPHGYAPMTRPVAYRAGRLTVATLPTTRLRSPSRQRSAQRSRQCTARSQADFLNASERAFDIAWTTRATD